jgi:hypothetical protein
MAEKRNRKYYLRKFLNKGPGIAAIEISGNSNDGFEITLSDCSRKISLDFFWYGGDETKESKENKFRCLLSELNKVDGFFFGKKPE